MGNLPGHLLEAVHGSYDITSIFQPFNSHITLPLKNKSITIMVNIYGIGNNNATLPDLAMKETKGQKKQKKSINAIF